MIIDAITYPPRDGYPLFITAKRYTLSEFKVYEDDPDALTLICLHSTASHKESWEPTLAKVFGLASEGMKTRKGDPRREVKIREAWCLDCPNHGASAMLNERILQTPEYYLRFSCELYAQAVLHFLSAGPEYGAKVDFKARNLVGIGHSLGGNAMSMLQTMTPRIPFISLVLVEPMLSPAGPKHLSGLRSLLIKGAYERRDVWSNRKAALEGLPRRDRTKKWDERVVQLFIKHGIRPHQGSYYLESPYNGVTLACTRDQEAAMYRDPEGGTKPVESLNKACQEIPVHLVLGGVYDFLPKRIHDALVDPKSGRRFASVTVIPESGHLVPLEMPDRLGEIIYGAFVQNAKQGPLKANLVFDNHSLYSQTRLATKEPLSLSRDCGKTRRTCMSEFSNPNPIFTAIPFLPTVICRHCLGLPMANDDRNDSSLHTRTLKDPIHDQIEINPTLSSFIDTRQFQRLRNIKQLGTTYYVWPGACHNRFEHCIGVSYLSRLLICHLQTSQPELGITERDVTCLELAGLCHDLGHGPWSHVFDSMFIPKAFPDVPPEERWTHEKGSEDMFEYLVRENEIDISDVDKEFIKALIAGDWKRTPDEKRFLFDIVANKINGLDVDKFDYIARDSRMVGDGVNINIGRIVKSARVIDDQICYDHKDVNNIFDICATRFKLHKNLYNHKTAKAIEYMIVDILLLANDHYKIAESVSKPERYIHLTDCLLEKIAASEEEELKEARQLVRRIQTRNLYRRVDYRFMPYDLVGPAKKLITSQKIVDAVQQLVDSGKIEDLDPELDVAALKPEDVIVDFSTMHYGMKEKNPVDNVRFYSKRDLNKCYPAREGDYSSLRPTVYAETVLQVFTKDPDFFGVVQAGYRHVVESLGPEALMTASVAADTVAMEEERSPSPVPTEAPSTPGPSQSGPSHSTTITPAASLTNVLTSSTNKTPQQLSLACLQRQNVFTTVDAKFQHQSPAKQRQKPRSTSGRSDAGGSGVTGATPSGDAGSDFAPSILPSAESAGSAIEMANLGDKRSRYNVFMEEPGSPSPKRRKSVAKPRGS
ncbi:hypothetical protein D9758_008643 [Tetrapyrgos nigripes]|uniref:HD/PDEase domain-containing protein n=1 Tax=Tetrapyrgos nigripes TaxID=182062 RepID=A0A8H5D7K4_9AGAR|nr:hypothetical protein D9758_008643 [Tetrapyrgos nigripes]